MFTDNEEPKNDCKLDNTSLDASPSTLQEPSETNSPDFEDSFCYFSPFFVVVLFVL
jgi:hypothetical protein